jgi:transposase
MNEKYKITLRAEEREQLEALIRKGTHAAQKVINALILLNCDEAGPERETRRSSREMAQVLQVSERKIDRVKRRFVEDGFEVALQGREGRTNYDRVVDGDVEAHLVALSCSEPPEGQARWTLKLLAQKAVELQYVEAVSYETVRKTLKKTNSSHGRRWAG